ncbi:MAG TPA: di-heme oxidoredictase family protein [Longimicrobiales bacterium]|nr:di-heme oxidoredictase family protein [Longimicrobiales bacterium]
MMGRRATAQGIVRVTVAVTVAATACRPEASTPGPELGDPLPGLTDRERGRFLLGRALFERVTTPEEGLGPLYNEVRCSGCHESPVAGGGSAEVQVLKATRFIDGECDLLATAGGDNIQRRATELLANHGLGPEEIPPGATDSALIDAPPLFGLGLVEAIPDSVLEGLADPEDRDGDGVSGRLPRSPEGRPARFGRKGDAVDIAGFIDTALRFELGLTTPEHPVEEARNGVPIPREADPAPEPEIDARGVALLTDYVRFLAPPAPERPARGASADSVADGADLFRAIGCARCHVPELRTGDSTTAALRDRPVRLYSDLQVHDLGLTADVCGRDVAPGEYRTAPLWGLRHRRRYLHDGRATDLLSAIARHGGEARGARDRLLRASPEARAALLRFLSSL